MREKRILYLGSLGHRDSGAQRPQPGTCLPVMSSTYSAAQTGLEPLFWVKGGPPVLTDLLVKQASENVS